MAKNYLDPEVLAKIERLELRARTVVEGFISGMHRSPYHGYSVEFAQHREYTPGDDIKHIDWRVYARNERYYIKQYEEETNLVATLLLDGSESMAYSSPAASEGLSKLEYGKMLVASLAFFAVNQCDAAALGAFDDGVRAWLERGTTLAHVGRVCETLAKLEPGPRGDTGAILKEFAARVNRRGIVLIVSDLFADVDSVLKGIQRFRLAGNEVVVLHVLDEYELTFPFEGRVKFKGLEGLGERLCHPRMLREAYLGEMHAYLTRMKAACRRMDVGYELMNTKTPVDVALTAYLAGRDRFRKGRSGGRPR